MSQLLHIDAEYKQWIQELSLRYHQSQIKASIRVNSEMLRFYWSVGKDITERQFDNKYGSHFYENLSKDLVAALNVKKGFSPTNLKYTKYFYNLYSPLSENRRQVADELVNANRQQPADDFELLFCIPWSHHQRIIDKVQGDSQKALFFVRKTWENQWGRGMLVNFLDTDLYEREGKALSNFSTALPVVESDFAQQLIKDPYHFEFLQLNEKYSETELKDELMKKALENRKLEFLKKLVNSAQLSDVLDDNGLPNQVITGLRCNIDGTKLFGRARTLKIRKLDEGEDFRGIYDALKSYAEISDNDIIIVENECPDFAYFGELNTMLSIRSGASGTIVGGVTRER